MCVYIYIDIDTFIDSNLGPSIPRDATDLGDPNLPR